jgi:hypothetical protein
MFYSWDQRRFTYPTKYSGGLTSRNRVVLASREAEITRDSGVWPGAFFNPPTDEELRILDEATREIEDVTANLAHFSRIAALTSRHWRGESA